MATKGKRFTYHGSYLKKPEAVAKEQAVGGFIRETTVCGKPRFFVLSENKSK